jgi:uncharacterized radical SAM superfamily Fe-S cluster-containing enzyme
MANRTLSSATSLCPECLEKVPGRYVEDDEGSVLLERDCPEHGEATRKVWGSADHWEWASAYSPDFDAEDHTTVDGDHACLAVVEVTSDCNLSCSYCFASSGPGGEHLPFDEVTHLLDVVRENGGPRPIQFSGGEPTVRDDLPELIEHAVEEGFEHIQVNTNGVRIAREDGYAERLEEAGVTAVYLQFDGTTRETYEEIREADILDAKHEAIEACRRADLPVVLVPTVVPGVNDDEMGDVVSFALENADIVESVNFQPVAQFGRYDEVGHDGRFALDEAARTLAEQMDELGARDLMPIPCCSSYCQMATVLAPRDGRAVPLTKFIDDELFETLSGMVDESDWMELLAGTEAGGESACSAAGCCGGASVPVPDVAEEALDGVLPVSITGFMDADAADADRLANCCVSVPTPDGELVPFCAYNMTTEDGRYELRNRNGWGGRAEAGAPSSSASASADNRGLDVDEPVRRGETETKAGGDD